MSKMLLSVIGLTLYHTEDMKAFADNGLNLATIIISVFDRVKNIVRKGENAGYKHFLLFSQCFQYAYSSGLIEVWIVL